MGVCLFRALGGRQSDYGGSSGPSFGQLWSELYFDHPAVQRTFGALQAAGGVAQAMGGVALCATVVGCIPGAALIARGADDIWAGTYTAVTGNAVETLTYRAAKWATGSDAAAFGVDFATGLISPAAAAKTLASGARLARAAKFAAKLDDVADASRAARSLGPLDDLARSGGRSADDYLEAASDACRARKRASGEHGESSI